MDQRIRGSALSWCFRQIMICPASENNWCTTVEAMECSKTCHALQESNTFPGYAIYWSCTWSRKKIRTCFETWYSAKCIHSSQRVRTWNFCYILTLLGPMGSTDQSVTSGDWLKWDWRFWRLHKAVDSYGWKVTLCHCRNNRFYERNRRLK